jgi:hypothetical protein
MKQSLVFVFQLFVLFSVYQTKAQSDFVFSDGSVKRTFSFETINNLIVVPVKINGVTFSFILDSGVNRTILFNNDLISALQLKNKTSINLRGFSNSESIKAFKVEASLLEIDRLRSFNHEILLLEEGNLSFSQRMGTQIDGILGASLFKNYKITVNYNTERLRIERSQEKTISCRKCSVLPIRFRNSKPLVSASIIQENGETIQGDFLIDSGSSDALWLFDQHDKIEKPTSFFPDFLGIGINGDVFGDRSKVETFRLGNFKLNQVKAAFPDSLGSYKVLVDSNRIGSIGGELLKRFKVTFDYPNNQIVFKKTSKTFDRFYYNLSGIELQYKGESLVKEKVSSFQSRDVSENESQNRGIKIYLSQLYRLRFRPIIEIANLRVNSPAALAGLKEGDIITEVNGKRVGDIDLQEIMHQFQKKPGQK